MISLRLDRIAEAGHQARMLWLRSLVLMAVLALALSAPQAQARVLDEIAPVASSSQAHGDEALDCPDGPTPHDHQGHAFCQASYLAVFVEGGASPLAAEAVRLPVHPARLELSGVDVFSMLRPPRG